MDAQQAQLLTTTLQSLANAINNMAAPAGGGAAPAPVTDLHGSADAYDLHTREGKAAYDEACAPFEPKFDGTNETLPSLFIAIKERARLCNWDARKADGTPEDYNIMILNITGPTGAGGGATTIYKHIIEDIGSITAADLTSAITNRADARAKQNSKCFSKALSKSLSGNLHDNFFSQPENLPSVEDGPTFFKAIVNYTTVNTMEAAFTVSDELQAIDPSKFAFDIVKINTELTRLLTLYSIGPFASNVDNKFKLLIMLKTYIRIKRPEEWHTTVERWSTQCSEGVLTDPKVLSANAVTKFQKLKCFKEEYAASLESDAQRYVAMTADAEKRVAAAIAKVTKAAASSTRRTPKKNDADDAASKASEGAGSGKKPPFVKQIKKADGSKYKEDEMRMWKGTPWYFHISPTHREKNRWYIHKVVECSTCQKYKERQRGKGNEANDDDTPPSVSALSDLSELTEEPSIENLTTLLGAAYDQAQALDDLEDKEVITTMLADCLGTLEDS